MKVLAYITVDGDIDWNEMTEDEKEDFLDELLGIAGESTYTTVTASIVKHVDRDE